MVLQLEFLGRRVVNTQLFPTQTKYRDLLISTARQISTFNNIHTSSNNSDVKTSFFCEYHLLSSSYRPQTKFGAR